MICGKCGGSNFSEKGYCRDCRAAYMREWNKNNPDKVRDSRKRRNPVKLKEYQDRYRAKHSDSIKESQKSSVEKNKEHYQEYKNAWYMKNRERMLESSRISREHRKALNPEDFNAKSAAKMRKWRMSRNPFSTMVSVSGLVGVEEIRPDPSNPDMAQVKCAYCNKWFNPTRNQVATRVRVIRGDKGGESRLYCSDGCKDSCPIFNVISWPKGFKKTTSREVEPELRKMVFERDEWKCQICHSEDSLHCHHIEGYARNKMLANDIENCITLCKTHHEWVHSKEGCRYFDLRCD